MGQQNPRCGSNYKPKVGPSRRDGTSELPLVCALDLERSLPDPAAQVVELGAAHLSTVGNFNLGNPRRVHLEDPLDTLSVGYFPNGECGVNGAAPLGDDYPCKYLDPLLVSLAHEGMDLYRVTDVESSNVFLELLLFDFLDDVHGFAAWGDSPDLCEWLEGREGYTMPPGDAIVFCRQTSVITPGRGFFRNSHSLPAPSLRGPGP